MLIQARASRAACRFVSYAPRRVGPVFCCSSSASKKNMQKKCTHTAAAGATRRRASDDSVHTAATVKKVRKRLLSLFDCFTPPCRSNICRHHVRLVAALLKTKWKPRRWEIFFPARSVRVVCVFIVSHLLFWEQVYGHLSVCAGRIRRGQHSRRGEGRSTQQDFVVANFCSFL